MSNATAKHQLWKLDEAGKFTPVFFSVFFFCRAAICSKAAKGLCPFLNLNAPG